MTAREWHAQDFAEDLDLSERVLCAADLVLIMFTREFESVFRRRLILIMFPHEFESVFRRKLEASN